VLICKGGFGLSEDELTLIMMMGPFIGIRTAKRTRAKLLKVIYGLTVDQIDRVQTLLQKLLIGTSRKKVLPYHQVSYHYHPFTFRRRLANKKEAICIYFLKNRISKKCTFSSYYHILAWSNVANVLSFEKKTNK
jgi:hypothetical protein